MYSARDTLQNCLIPLGLFLGGILADNVFEPLMQSTAPAVAGLRFAFGSENGAGIAFQFFVMSFAVLMLSLLCRKGLCACEKEPAETCAEQKTIK